MLMTIRTISPVDGSVYAERTAATAAQIDQTLQRARAARPKWREVPIAERAAIIERFCGEFERRGAAIATGLSWQKRSMMAARSAIGTSRHFGRAARARCRV